VRDSRFRVRQLFVRVRVAIESKQASGIRGLARKVVVEILT
jgi:hypothetical protein